MASNLGVTGKSAKQPLKLVQVVSIVLLFFVASDCCNSSSASTGRHARAGSRVTVLTLWKAACTMTPNLVAVTGKSAKQPQKLVQVVSIVLLFFVASEFLLQQQLGINTKACRQRSALPRGESISANNAAAAATGIPILANSPTVHEAFTPDIVLHWDNLTKLAPEGLQTFIDTSDGDEVRFMRYGLSPLRNVCIRPNGTIVVVGLSEEEFSRSLGETMALEWKETYNCSWGCNGAAFEKETPKDALWINGNTTHIIPYLENVFHHFAERVWPHLTGFQDKDKTLRKQYYVHRMHTWLEQAHYNLDRNTFMFQIALLSRIGRTKFLQHREDETRPLCFERLTLCSAATGRMSPKLGLANFGPAIARYRESAFKYFAIASPEVSLPPHPLRVTLYGRSDASRRRVTNIAVVADYLRSGTQQPPMLVTFVDELLEKRLYNQTLPEVVSLMAQTDVYITPHGANTWATMFMPKRAAVLEIYGPCGPTTWIGETIVPALELKHETEGNPWGARVGNARAGNTTECRSALETPDFTIDVVKLRVVLEQLLRKVDGPGDRLPLHWLFDWRTNSY